MSSRRNYFIEEQMKHAKPVDKNDCIECETIGKRNCAEHCSHDRGPCKHDFKMELGMPICVKCGVQVDTNTTVI